MESCCKRRYAGGICKTPQRDLAELVSVLKEAGIYNYTIWNVGNELFGYYECEKGCAYAAKVQADSPIVDKWNEFMKDVMIMEMDPETEHSLCSNRFFHGIRKPPVTG